MPIIEPKEKTYAFDAQTPPLYTVKQGEPFALYTENALAAEEGYFNPLTGPIHIEGAEKGDVLAVEILSVEPKDGTALSRVHNGVGALSPTEDMPLLGTPPMEKAWHYRQTETGDFLCEEDARLRFAYQPFIGTLGTAPLYERISSVAARPVWRQYGCERRLPRPYGLSAGVYQRCSVVCGRLPRLQGDGELCGTALEMTAKVSLKCRVIKQKSISGPRIETPTHLYTVAAAKPLESAARMAYRALIDWMGEYGWDELSGYQAVTQAGSLYVGQIVNPLYTMVAGIEKSLVTAQK